MVAYIGRLAVTRRKWISEGDFKAGVALCQAMPGATAMQTAAYVGLRSRGFLGAILAYVGFGFPAFALMLALSVAYQRAHDLRMVTAGMAGLRVVVVALVANATWMFGRSSIKALRECALAAAAAVLFLLGRNPLLIVGGSALAGALLFRRDSPIGGRTSDPSTKSVRALIPPALVLLLALALVVSLLVLDRRLAVLALIMMKVDAFAFGGGFASVPLMLHEIVDARRWMSSSVFMDGIALGQVTPGPIVITATFVGYQVAGIAGALVGTLSIFLPSFFVLLLVEPWYRRLNRSRIFHAAVCGAMLSFVGLLVSVTIRFAQVAPWNVRSVSIGALAFLALVRRVAVVWVVLAGAVLSVFLM